MANGSHGNYETQVARRADSKIGVLAAIRGGNLTTLSKQTAGCGPGIQIGALPLLLETIMVDALTWLAECHGDSEVRDPTASRQKTVHGISGGQ